MATLKLNIYKSQKEIEKTYEAESYDLMFGTAEEVLNIFDPDKMTNNVEIATTVFKCFNQLKPILQEMFPGVTDDELKHVKIKELIPLFVNVCKQIADDIGLLSQGNQPRA